VSAARCSESFEASPPPSSQCIALYIVLGEVFGIFFTAAPTLRCAAAAVLKHDTHTRSRGQLTCCQAHSQLHGPGSWAFRKHTRKGGSLGLLTSLLYLLVARAACAVGAKR